MLKRKKIIIRPAKIMTPQCRLLTLTAARQALSSSGGTSMAGETGVDREGASPPGPINSISWVGPGGPKV